MELARFANKYFNDKEPWKTRKSDPQVCATTINLCLQMVRSLSILAEPVIPNSVRKIWKILNITDNPNWDEAGELNLPTGQKINQSEILFTKIEDEAIQAEIERLNKVQASMQSSQKMEPKFEPQINFETFKKLDLRVAKVLKAEAVKKSDKLLKLQIEIGNTERQIIAGIAMYYKPENLIGKKIIVIANLKPATIRGNPSEGMLLAASDENQLALLTVLEDIPSGAKIS
jgi:methionyl-tRNA synthetase